VGLKGLYESIPNLLQELNATCRPVSPREILGHLAEVEVEHRRSQVRGPSRQRSRARSSVSVKRIGGLATPVARETVRCHGEARLGEQWLDKTRSGSAAENVGRRDPRRALERVSGVEVSECGCR
jgi:hypothetical protein